ncbi:hypothetical protein GLP21_12090 [Photobacterium carnosum]|uniref:DUF2726 domain-containing protein n=1 Tax=Photobacterium carnosum TaxID=2023717 RepID=A0A2N4UW07_9GAMM|nr:MULTISPECIES: hypothetical protein [Photobacterium]MCD9475806.1 hypothetical protein [Photobacterium phosphoreum]MCD9485856.1 hypothetical protein [Photobacterium iliopiscarium]MCD9507667.1 hypothetical protein [Photobacterium phosphoreum]MCD9538212.1 hypothetical protein [Photobacterium carnosum]MCD9543016.1 hypothetical protein [Photobacterium carnosum]
MIHDLFTSLFLILVVLFVIDIGIRISHIIVAKQQQKLLIKEDIKVATNKTFEKDYLKKPVYDCEATWHLFNGIIAQMGATYNIQFGTALSSMVKRTDNKDIEDSVLDICIIDPRTLKVVAVIVISQSGIYSTTSKKERRIIELLNFVNIPALTIKKQDFYSINEICAEVMDAIDIMSSLNNDKNDQSFY